MSRANGRGAGKPRVLRDIHPPQRQRRCCGGRVAKAFRRPHGRPLPVRPPDRNGGFPRAFGQGADGPWLSDGAHGLRCPATPRHARLAESLGKPSPWPARIPTRTNAPRPTPACRAEARQSEKTARRRHRRPLRPARAQRNSSRSTGLAAAWLEKPSDCGPRLLTAAKSRARSQK